MSPTQPRENETELREGIRQMLARLGDDVRPFEVHRISGGGNNRVYRVDVVGSSEGEGGDSPANRDSRRERAPRSTESQLGSTARATLLLKSYFQDDRDPRNRAEAEFRFLQFAWSVGVRCVPQPFEHDTVAGLGLMEFVEGRPVSAPIGDLEVRESLAFLRALNRFREGATGLPNASEACFSLAHHVDTVDSRVNRLTHSSSEWTCPEVMDFLISRLVPQWTSVRDDFRIHATESGLAFEAELPIFERLVSPSDFGFHNALRTSAGPLTFLDFEYAGWDDPAKLVCDYFTQPSVPVPSRYLEQVVATVTELLDLDGERAERLRTRVELLLPMYRVKWCCILLNELSPAGRARREFSGDAVSEERIHAQLEKAVSMLETVSS